MLIVIVVFFVTNQLKPDQIQNQTNNNYYIVIIIASIQINRFYYTKDPKLTIPQFFVKRSFGFCEEGWELICDIRAIQCLSHFDHAT